MLSDVVRLIACPVCDRGVRLAGRALVCESGHSVDVARQGHVNLLAGRARSLTADSTEMVAARVAFLERGHYVPIADAVLDCLPRRPHTAVVDLGSGPGWYLARVLAGLPRTAVGLALDLSPAAVRRAARCHPRAGAAVADTWSRLPVLDGSVQAALGVFAPRNLPEVRRVLGADGRLVVVTPTPGHLAGLRGPLGLLEVEPGKQERLAAAATGVLTEVSRQTVRYVVPMGRQDVAALVLMGPSRRHGDPAGRERALDALPDVVEVSVAVRISVFGR